MKIKLGLSLLAFSAAALLAATGHAGLSVSQHAIADAWNDPIHVALQTTGLPNTNSTVSNGGNDTNRTALTITTGASGFQLSKFAIVAAGGPSDGKVSIYPAPVGGTETDGFVNVQFSTDLLTGIPFNSLTQRPGLPFHFNGTADETILEFNLTHSHEIFLAPNTKYAIDFVADSDANTPYNFFVRRGGTFYTADGNLYSRPIAVDDGQRFDVAGGRRDAPLALYRVPEPATLALLGCGLVGFGLSRRKAS